MANQPRREIIYQYIKMGCRLFMDPKGEVRGERGSPCRNRDFHSFPLLKATGIGELVTCSTFGVTNVKRYIHNFPAATQDP